MNYLHCNIINDSIDGMEKYSEYTKIKIYFLFWAKREKNTPNFETMWKFVCATKE